VTGDRLSAIEAGYLYVEGPGYPMHVGSVATFEAGPLLDGAGRLRIDDLRALVAGRLDLLPQLRRRVVWPPLDLDRPRWEDDPTFDVAHHMDVVEAPAPGDDEVLQRLAAETWSERLDRSHPLWHMRFVTGLDAGRVALIERTHHALVDGVAGVDVAAVMLGTSPEVEIPRPSAWTPAPPAPDAVRAATGLRDQLLDWVEVAAGAGATLAHPATLADRVRAMADVASTLAADGLAPHSSFNRPTGVTRRLAWVRARLEQVKAAGARAGGTANDVVLAAVAGGVRATLLHRGEAVAHDAVLKILVPVSIRRADEHGVLGNRVSGLVVPLPIGLGDPGQRLAAIAAETTRRKSGHDTTATVTALDAADRLPPALLRWIAPVVHHQPLVNLVVTNVPGPGVPLYLMGARMLEAFPIVPLVGNLSVGVAVLSYDGALTIGVTADEATCPDLDVLVDGIERSLHALCATDRTTARRWSA
jgi:WS/DGAT/MGAT family acyltransferase